MNISEARDKYSRLIAILVLACDSAEDRPKLIAQFQGEVWDMPDDDTKEQVILSELAYDLDFYEPNEEWRREDASFINEEQAVLEIREALRRLGAQN